MFDKEKKERKDKGGEVVSINNISFVSYDRVLFYDVDFKVHKGQVVIVTGKSGSGKSVLLRTILGTENPNEGEVNRKGNLTISYVPQTIEDIDLKLNENPTVKEFFYQSRGLDKVETRKEELENLMADGNNGSLDEYGEILNKFEQLGGYNADEEIGRILEGLKLSERFTGHIGLDTKIRQVSSGQHTRLLIGRALFANSDLLMLDDPTSHLDVESVKWLATFLKSRSQAVLVATQNTAFAEMCADRIVEITDFGRVLSFEGSYSQFSTKRDNLLAAERVAAEAAKEKYDRLQQTYSNFKSRGFFKNSAEFAQVGRAMQTRLKKMEEKIENTPGATAVYRDEKARPMRFETSNERLNNSISIHGIQKKYDKHPVINLPNLDITVKKEKILLISGENGSGKSTFLRMVADCAKKTGDFLPDKGMITIEDGLSIGYYSPGVDNLPKKGNVFEELLRVMPRRNEAEATSTLIFFGFPHQNLRQLTVETISIGEKKQLALAEIMVQKPDILLLDEPTDNLKPEVVKRLSEALKKYSGTTIIIAHDPNFVRDLDVDQELLLPSGKLINHRH